MPKSTYAWAARGDVNAFFGLMLDNIADLVLAVSLLGAAFAFPTNFALQHMVPGTALGVLVGDLLFFFLALRVAHKTGNNSLTAMPLGLDTPSTFGMVFLVLGPAFVAAKGAGMEEFAAAKYTWHIGICAIFISGLFKMFCAAVSGWIRRMIPRAGLLGSLTAVALILISFLPLLEVMHAPIIGMVALSMIFTTLVARVDLPWKIPGALGTMLVAGAMYYLMVGLQSLGALPSVLHLPPADVPLDPWQGLWPTGWLSAFRFEWTSALVASLNYLPIILPFALATVIGGIDCTESAAAAGDEYNTGQVIAIEAFATLVAALCGGVIQTVPYIGHPAYKAMGGRSAYTLATALFIGAAGALGFFGFMYVVIPKATVFPILIFVGLEITAQSFQATTKRHYPAVALACVPALAYLAMMYVKKMSLMVSGDLPPSLQAETHTLMLLSNGFFLSSVIWSSALAMLIDHRLRAASAFFFVAMGCSLFGLMHSPIPTDAMFLPTQLTEAQLGDVISFALGYGIVGAGLLVGSFYVKPLPIEEEPSISGIHHPS